MGEYIEKRLALEELENLRQKCEMHDDCDELIARKCKKAVSLLPVADVAPVVHGKWEYNKDATDWGIGGYVCSECKNKNNNLPCNRVKTVRMFSGAAYCPNCGAKMDGGE